VAVAKGSVILKTAIVNLGCPKNEVDAEKLAYLLDQEGFRLVEPAAAEIIIVNTCAFIQPAVEEAIETILELGEYKHRACRLLAVCGCLPQRYGAELLEEIPEIDLLFGVADWDRIPAALRNSPPSPAVPATRNHIGPRNYQRTQDLLQLLPPPGVYAYLKIAEGCDNHCRYCTIPAIKGRQQSVPQPLLLRQAKALVAGGAKEIDLVAQDLTAYGRDFGKSDGLCGLLEELTAISGLLRLRLLYAYPGNISPRLIALLAEKEQICNYIDMPIQHIDDEILAAMGRRESGTEIRRLLARLREQVPEIYLRSTVMVGYPGESEIAFKRLLALVEEGSFDYLGVFPFWPEDGTRAASLPNQLPDDLKQERMEILLDAQRRQIEKRLQSEIGRCHRVLIEGESQETELLLAGRTAFQAPEIDGITYITEGETRIGELVEVEIHDTYQFDLYGRIV
jgi:ribosomal protein S12 methylthiotransferase